MAKHCGHPEALVSGREINGGVLNCPDCLLSEYTKLLDEFDLRLVEGDGPHVVHVPTWERMQPAVDAMGTTIAELCAQMAEPCGKGAMMSNVGPGIAAAIRERFAGRTLIPSDAELDLAREDMRINGLPPTPARWQRKFAWSYRKASEVMVQVGALQS